MKIVYEMKMVSLFFSKEVRMLPLGVNISKGCYTNFCSKYFDGQMKNGKSGIQAVDVSLETERKNKIK